MNKWMHIRMNFNSQHIMSIFHCHLSDYPTPLNLNIWWGFGSILGLCLSIQIMSGIILAMHYSPQLDIAATSIQHIMRSVPGGWIIRNMHANGASMCFVATFIHMLRGLQLTNELIWGVGITLLILMIIIAFVGYVLPWGQMSFWGATVITTLASSISDNLVIWLWGGMCVDNATLNRFFSLHYLLPLFILAISVIHISAIHQYGSNNTLCCDEPIDICAFYPYYIIKDTYIWLVYSVFGGIFIYFMSYMLGHASNFMDANPLITPQHIVPEWYLLAIYALLRSIPNKLGGIIAIVVLFIVLMKVGSLFAKNSCVFAIASAFIGLSCAGAHTSEFSTTIGQLWGLYLFYVML